MHIRYQKVIKVKEGEKLFNHLILEFVKTFYRKIIVVKLKKITGEREEKMSGVEITNF